MLTIVNINKIGLSTLRVAGEKWELKHIAQPHDLYQFIYRCIEAHPAGGLLREAVINLGRTPEMFDLGGNLYELRCMTNGKSRLVDLEHLKAPGRLIGPMLRVIDGC